LCVVSSCWYFVYPAFISMIILVRSRSISVRKEKWIFSRLFIFERKNVVFTLSETCILRRFPIRTNMHPVCMVLSRQDKCLSIGRVFQDKCTSLWFLRPLSNKKPRFTINLDRLIILSESSLLGWFLQASLTVIIKGRSPLEVSLIVIIKLFQLDNHD
jgi:hypothetical protein